MDRSRYDFESQLFRERCIISENFFSYTFQPEYNISINNLIRLQVFCLDGEGRRAARSARGTLPATGFTYMPGENNCRAHSMRSLNRINESRNGLPKCHNVDMYQL